MQRIVVREKKNGPASAHELSWLEHHADNML